VIWLYRDLVHNAKRRREGKAMRKEGQGKRRESLEKIRTREEKTSSDWPLQSDLASKAYHLSQALCQVLHVFPSVSSLSLSL
jgi:hypothetical protein